MEKNTITIGISVYNEEKNIEKLLLKLLKQNVPNGEIKQILVISDKSIDGTEKIVERIKKQNQSIRLIKGKVRKGKPQRMNEIFKNSSSSVVIILDGDIIIKSNLLVSRLVEPLFRDKSIGLTSGLALYLPARTFFEQIMAVGLAVWNDTKKSTPKAEMYTCEGQVRAFSKTLYKQLTFPRMSADDVHPYLYAKKNNIGYKYVDSAKVYFYLPSTLTDYIKQHTRYLQSKRIQKNSFDHQFVEGLYAINFSQKILSTFKFLKSNPVEMIFYSVILIFPKILVHLGSFGVEPNWSIVNSTKK